MTDLIDISGRVALVTGAASGIGRATAELLSGLGATVFATDQDGPGVAAAFAGRQGLVTAQHDVTSEEDWDRVFGQVGDRLDILVNNAGIMLAAPFLETQIEELRRQYRINVEGPFFGMQRAIPVMLRSIAAHGARPSIVNVSSIYGQIVGGRFSAYSASKGAVKMLSKAVANECAGAGIRVNSVHPGPTATNLSAQHPPDRDENGEPVPLEVYRARVLSRIPMGRAGTPGDIASVIAFLASDAAAYVTGAEIVVDGAYSAV